MIVTVISLIFQALSHISSESTRGPRRNIAKSQVVFLLRKSLIHPLPSDESLNSILSVCQTFLLVLTIDHEIND